MTSQQFISDLEAVKRAIIAELPDQVERMGFDLAAIVKKRVVEKGKDSEGGSFTAYSSTQLPAWFFKGKSRNNSGESAVTALAKQGEKMSYKDFRRVNGLNAGMKNFEFTGEMWRGVVVEVQEGGTAATLTIQGGTAPSEDRLKWHSEREKTNLLDPSKEELTLASRGLIKWLTVKVTAL